MDALTLLKKDHDLVKDLLQRIDACEDSEECGELFHHLGDRLKDHETIEEEIFYPTLKQVAKAKELVLEAYEEHQLVDYILEDMHGLPFDSDEWIAKFKVAAEAVEHHIEQEESRMFKLARKAFDRGELEGLGQRMEERQVELQMSHH
jgi:hypothetical protein